MPATWTSLSELLHDHDHAGDERPTTAGLAGLLGAIATARPSWHRHAACRGEDVALFFPERGEPTGPARAVCLGCKVRRPCLDAALELSELQSVGIWGGTSARERRELRRPRLAG